MAVYYDEKGERAHKNCCIQQATEKNEEIVFRKEHDFRAVVYSRGRTGGSLIGFGICRY